MNVDCARHMLERALIEERQEFGSFFLSRFLGMQVSYDPDGNLAPWYHTHDDTPERVDADALSRATDFVVALARLIDRDAGRTAGAPAASEPPAAAERV